MENPGCNQPKKNKHDFWWWITRPFMIVASGFLVVCVIFEIIQMLILFLTGYSMGSAFAWLCNKIEPLLEMMK